MGFQAQSPTTSLWKTFPTGKIKFFSNPNLIVFITLRTLAAYQHKASGVTIMKQKTILPRYAEVLQYDHNDGENHPNHANFQGFNGFKDGMDSNRLHRHCGLENWGFGRDAGRHVVGPL